MSTIKKQKIKIINTQESYHNGTHPSEEELQNWTLLPDALTSEESERIKKHVDGCEICTVYCELVRTAEKDVEVYLQTELGRNRGQNLLYQIAAQRHAVMAKVASTPTRLSVYNRRQELARLEKLAIGKVISYMLARGNYPGESVGIDGGTTNEAVAEVLSREAANNEYKKRVLVTNHRLIPQFVSQQSDRFHVIGIGGLYRPDRETFVGDHAIQSIRRLQCSASVLGINSFNPPWLLTSSGREDGIKRAFIRSSRDIILAFDSSKWGVHTGSKLVELPDLFRSNYLLDPDGRTVHIVTTYPVVTDTDKIDNPKVLLHRDRFLTGLKRLTTNGCRGYGSLLRGAIVRFADEKDLDLMVDSELYRLDDLPSNYFDNLEKRMKKFNTSAQSILVVWIQLIGSYTNQREPVDEQPQTIESSLGKVAYETNMD